MSRRVIFMVASALIFLVLDLSWVYPLFFDHLGLVFSWVAAFALAGFEIVALLAEWSNIEWSPWPKN